MTPLSVGTYCRPTYTSPAVAAPSDKKIPDYKNYLRQLLIGLEVQNIEHLLSGEEVDPALFRYLGERITIPAKAGAQVSATLPTESLTMELARALLRAVDEGKFGHLIRAGNFFSVIQQAKTMVSSDSSTA